MRLLVMVILAFTAMLILYLWPQQYTPLASFILSCLFFVLARMYRFDEAVKAAEERGEIRASERWLPQAESAIRRLITVWGSVRSFRNDLATGCSNAVSIIPELATDENKTIKVYIELQCRTGAQRLGDVINHVEDALTDWERFAAANCRGIECGRIEATIEECKRQREIQLRDACGNRACINHKDYNAA